MSAFGMRDIMTLLENDSNFANGVYCSGKPSTSTTDALASFCAVNDIPNPISKSDMHTTIIYSEQGNPNFEWQPTYQEPIKAKFAGFDMFGEEKNVLVLKLKSPELSRRHKELMEEYGLSYNFDEYRPHITLSYDAEGFDISKLDDYFGDLIITGEDANELDTDWEPEDDAIRKTE